MLDEPRRQSVSRHCLQTLDTLRLLRTTGIGIDKYEPDVCTKCIFKSMVVGDASSRRRDLCPRWCYHHSLLPPPKKQGRAFSLGHARGARPGRGKFSRSRCRKASLKGASRASL